jgi:hypothetical protein
MASEAPETWTELKAYIADQLNRTDMTTQIPQWIAKFERHAVREIFTPDRETAADITVDAEEEDLPAGLQRVVSVHLTTDPLTFLEQMTLPELRTRYAANTTGKPENYALRGNKLVFGPSPDTTYTAKLVYVATITPLDGTTASNWLLADHVDAYIEGTLFEAHKFLKDMESAAMAKASRDEIIAEINRSGRRRSYGGAPLRIRAPQVV